MNLSIFSEQWPTQVCTNCEIKFFYNGIISMIYFVYGYTSTNVPLIPRLLFSIFWSTNYTDLYPLLPLLSAKNVILTGVKVLTESLHLLSFIFTKSSSILWVDGTTSKQPVQHCLSSCKKSWKNQGMYFWLIDYTFAWILTPFLFIWLAAKCCWL